MDLLKNFKIGGIIFLIMSLYFFYKRNDVIREILRGRDINLVEIDALILPLILIILGFMLILKKSKKDENKD
ncbi:hypothetical protein KO494_02945 [Lacinutrix sp. C3R15]|uniref:hypothetical protein n=1 Tax=Flavobacteriaceae TaxID=49546 RepID=UPI001C0A0C63|nr:MULTISPECIES: hypothetical protein [Flavobacteriaceae]MBU2938487.1 hypothetical protein [Lacinutrix sp. C3R15]MDO6621801.1 hypothetical protein [Oceanihabitans sp. 1_MG-2023]